MCSYGLAALAVAAVAAGVSYEQNDQTAKRQQAAIDTGAEADALATKVQYEQINKSAMDSQAQLRTNYLIDSARISAMQGESGMQGASHDRVTQEAANNADSDMATLEHNRANQAENAHLQGAAQGNRAALQMAGIKRASAAGTALQIGGEVAAYKIKNPDSPSAPTAPVVGG